MSYPATITKRHGTAVSFNLDKIRDAITKAFLATKPEDVIHSELLAFHVLGRLRSEKLPSLTVEHVQNVVEEVLMDNGHLTTAKAYILYRHEHAKLRAERKPVSEKLRSLFSLSRSHFASDYEYFIYLRTYSRFLEEEGRRETWLETVDRYMTFMRRQVGDKFSEKEYDQLREAIVNMEIMPSMRLLQFAGPAAERNHLCAYNCCFIAPTDIKDLRDIMYISMCGTGVGFSVERQFIEQFPLIKPQRGKHLGMKVIEDSKEGWCDALYAGLQAWYDGSDIDFDFSLIRPAGTRLKVTGGTASGPDPLKELLKFSRAKILAKQGTRLSSLEMHDLICKIGYIVVVGGVRRCHDGNNRVLVQEGSFKHIKDISVGDRVLTHDGTYKTVLNVFEQGKQELVRVYHKNGWIDVTPNHRMAVVTDPLKGTIAWKEASQLTAEDILAFPNYQPNLNAGKTAMPPFSYVRPKHSTTCKDITIPELDESMAWFLGEFLGDGYVRLTGKSGELSVAVFGEDHEQADEVIKQFQRFSVNVNKQMPKKNDNCYKLRVKSKQLATYFHTEFKQAKTTLRVPQCIKDAPARVKAAFVQGVMDADGCVKTRPVTLVVTIYEQFAHDIQALLHSMGILVRMKVVPKKQWQTQYTLSLINNRDKKLFRDYTEGIGFKKYPCDSVLHHTDRWPISMIKFDEEHSKPKNWTKKVATNNKHVPYDTLLDFDLPQPLLPVSVKKVEHLIEAQETFDIEVEDNHNFVVEGVLAHNSALISLSDLDDKELRDCKSGRFYEMHPHRCMANNSSVYNSIPTDQQLMEEWLALIQSGSGERGIVNRYAAIKTMPERRRELLEERVHQVGTNPCSEIILQSHGLCNLTTIVCRPHDTSESLHRKIALATRLGTYQATLTDFKYVSPLFKQRAEEERLLGVSMTGQQECPILKDPSLLRSLKEKALEVNAYYAQRLNISPSTAITCVKPEGTVSEMVCAAPGLHPKYYPYYLRRVRTSVHDPLTKLLREQGVPWHPEVGQTIANMSTVVFEFPIKATEGAVTVKDISAMDMLEYWKLVKTNYTEHNPSITINVAPNEWITVLSWLKANWDCASGLSFLPKFDNVYQLTPYEEITEQEYLKRKAQMDSLHIDYAKLIYYEITDTTEIKRELACAGGVCMMEDIPANQGKKRIEVHSEEPLSDEQIIVRAD